MALIGISPVSRQSLPRCSGASMRACSRLSSEAVRPSMSAGISISKRHIGSSSTLRARISACRIAR